MAASDERLVVHDLLAEWREGARAGLEARFRRAREEGDLADDSDPARLARYVLTVSNGLAVQAASGVAPKVLRGVVEEALSTRRRSQHGAQRRVQQEQVGGPALGQAAGRRAGQAAGGR
ncbi:hypothetical protein LRP67_02725 [Nocardioides sp. cx-169]|uniref:hypothetical protein n=1 Tax=Nocardioides sp. cx-169 TaxID=2899080 RepID=UPI001E44BA03|nr:hypothetical protein [Nocardioides sp. cx-169]MCD4532995.1 hypothetical protein [Nocardioides sp. cx-169]